MKIRRIHLILACAIALAFGYAVCVCSKPNVVSPPPADRAGGAAFLDEASQIITSYDREWDDLSAGLVGEERAAARRAWRARHDHALRACYRKHDRTLPAYLQD